MLAQYSISGSNVEQAVQEEENQRRKAGNGDNWVERSISSEDTGSPAEGNKLESERTGGQATEDTKAPLTKAKDNKKEEDVRPTVHRHHHPGQCGCIEKSRLAELAAAGAAAKKALGKSMSPVMQCNSFCNGSKNVRHFTVEDSTCLCFKHLHTIRCEEHAAGSASALVRVHCHHRHDDDSAGAEDDTAGHHLNYYHQRNTMAAIRTFNQLVTSAIGGGGEGEDGGRTGAPAGSQHPAVQFSAPEAKNDTGVTATPDDEESEVVKLGLPALVLGLLAAVTLAALALKAYCDKRRGVESKDSDAASTASNSTVTPAVGRPKPLPSRERLQSLSAGPFVYERR